MDSSLRLLIVDDEPKLRGLLERYLVRMGYVVEACDDAESGLARFTASPGDFALVVTDLTLPGMDGEQMLARMRELRPELGAVIASGYPHECASPAITRFLQKPFLPQMLVDAVQELLP